MKNEIEQIAQQNDMSIEFVTWFFNEKKVGCGNVWFMMMAAMWEGWKGRSIEMDKLAAENLALKQSERELDKTCAEEFGQDWVSEFTETPATDRIVAGIKADGVEEFIGRLQQYVDEGDFVGDEVDVIVGAIDCGKEFCEQLREGADK
ncbi:hypothetical protein [Klebsiella pneumoniae]|uniref:hypothetical protein n=1 Tax=Klebsiella pneumoniae TaxID=573 RepID=UPI00226DE59C|nr:hypothetical protein [Klebsiella pneumoniae]MCY0486958.1 hypothetical protein [Klebsiella pneumoniae]